MMGLYACYYSTPHHTHGISLFGHDGVIGFSTGEKLESSRCLLTNGRYSRLCREAANLGFVDSAERIKTLLFFYSDSFHIYFTWVTHHTTLEFASQVESRWTD